MFTSMIVDDEPLARERVAAHIKQRPGWKVCAEAAAYDEAYDAILKHKPDVCFMDIDIIGGSGVQLVKSLEKNVNSHWVFTTAHSQYALDAFDLQAADYLLKPFESERLNRVLNKLENNKKSTRKKAQQNLAVKSVGAVTFVNCDDILWVKGAANYAELHCRDRMLLHRETLSSLEDKLDSEKFVRVHRSAMVNLAHVESLNSELGRYSILQLSNGDEVKISSAYKDQLFESLGLDV